MLATPGAPDFTALKMRLKTTWMTGDYGLFARYMENDAALFYHRLGLKPGVRLLDVACGSGQIARIAARAGVRASGCDIAANWIEQARNRAREEGLEIQFDEGDAESLPYESAQFDAVVSLFGAMFAPRPDLVAAELIRVCRPGGVIAMGNWTPSGFIGQMFKTIAKHIAPSGMPSPVLWGDEDTVRQRLQPGAAEVRMCRRMYRFSYPFSAAAVVAFFRANYGPMACAFASLHAAAQDTLQRELTELWSTHNQNRDGVEVDAEFLEVTAIRS